MFQKSIILITLIALLVPSCVSTSPQAVVEPPAKKTANPDLPSDSTTDDELITNFVKSSVPEVQARVARAYLFRGINQCEVLNKTQACIDTYNILMAKYGNSLVPGVQVSVATAMYNKAYTQANTLKESSNALGSYNALLAKFSNSSVPDVQVQVAKAYQNKADLQMNVLKAPFEAINTNETLIAKFASSTVPEVQAQVANAHHSIGYMKLIFAKQEMLNKKINPIQLKEALAHFNFPFTRSNQYDESLNLVNLTYTQWLLGDKSNAEAQLQTALSKGGKDIYNAAINDTEKLTVPADKAFKILVNKVWTQLTAVKKPTP